MSFDEWMVRYYPDIKDLMTEQRMTFMTPSDIDTILQSALRSCYRAGHAHGFEQAGKGDGFIESCARRVRSDAVRLAGEPVAVAELGRVSPVRGPLESILRGEDV